MINSYTRANADDTDGWREITISTTALGDSRKSQDIVIKGQITIGTTTYRLQRKVTINLRPKYTMQLVCNPNAIQKKLGSPFDLIIKVPGGLGKSMFPLEFELEAAEQSITPDKGDDLPVVTGMSIVPEKNKTTIGFIKQLDWDDYDALENVGGYKSVPCHFKSNKDLSATAIYAQNKYFELASTNLGNYDPSTFSDLTFSPTTLPAAAGEKVDFTFTMSQLPSQGYVTVALENLEPYNDKNNANNPENETRLTFIDVVDGKALYSFNPTSNTETLHLMTASVGVPVSVTLSAYHFIDASASIEAEYVIPAGNIKVGNNTNIPSYDITFTLYTQNPGTSENVSNIASFTTRRNGSNSSAIELTAALYKTIMENGGNIYVRFYAYSYSDWNWHYYIATVLLSDLMDENGATLNFIKQ